MNTEKLIITLNGIGYRAIHEGDKVVILEDGGTSQLFRNPARNELRGILRDTLGIEVAFITELRYGVDATFVRVVA